MSQHDYVIDNASGATVRSDLNNALAAIVSNNSGATAPSTTYAYQWWADTTTGLLKRRNAANSAWVSVMDLAGGLIIGTDVQAYDANIVKKNAAQTFSGVQTTSETTDNDLSFDLSAAIDFKCTPTTGGVLTFTNIPATPTVQKGSVLLVNGSNYAITAHANTKVGSALLATISATGTYLLSYRTSNGLAYITASGVLA